MSSSAWTCLSSIDASVAHRLAISANLPSRPWRPEELSAAPSATHDAQRGGGSEYERRRRRLRSRRAGGRRGHGDAGLALPNKKVAAVDGRVVVDVAVGERAAL